MEEAERGGEAAVYRRSKATESAAHEGTSGLQVSTASKAQDSAT